VFECEEIKKDHMKPVRVIGITGSMTGRNALSQFREFYASFLVSTDEHPVPRIVLYLKGVRHIDSASLTEIVNFCKEASKIESEGKTGRVAIVDLGKGLQNLLVITAFSEASIDMYKKDDWRLGSYGF